jgi:hypothetical protein
VFAVSAGGEYEELVAPEILFHVELFDELCHM